MSIPIILGSETPDADVLVYDKDKKFFTGVVEIDVGGVSYDLEMNPNNGANKKVNYEFVSEV